jgi:allantoinase
MRFAVATSRPIPGLDPSIRAVVVEDGRVAAHAAVPPAGVPVVDVGPLVLMPGVVDTHVHVNEPGRTAWEGFATASEAAAAGGVTTLVDMPLNSIPVTTTVDALRAKRAAAHGQLRVDCGFWGGVIPGNEAELAPMTAEGALGFKAFTCNSGIDEFPACTEHDLRRAMPILRRVGAPLLVHAELERPVPVSAASPREYLTYLHSRPNAWEDAAVAMVVDLVRETGCRAHVVHLSSATALPLIRRAKADGLPITVETCPHYLCLRAEDVPDGATEYKCAPPIREDHNRAGLWQGLRDGTIDVVVTDHSPCVPSLKVPERGDFMAAWGGVASLELGLRNVWTEASARGFDLAHLTRWMSGATASLAGLAHKGTLAVGADADMVAWDPDAAQVIDAASLKQRHPVTPYLGRTVRGRVVHTWVRGHAVVWDGAHRGPPIGRTLGGRSARSDG